jgi:hypothetical protein
MARPISSVHVDIARLTWEVSQVPDSELAGWTLRLVKCLATRNPLLHEYGAHLLEEVEEYRKADLERKKAHISKDSKDSVDSKEKAVQTEQSRAEQTEQSIKNKENPAGLPDKPLRAKRKKEPEPHPDVSVVYEFYKEKIKASTRKADALKWIERRGGEVGFEKLIMSVALYMLKCKQMQTKDEFKKDCANFFGEDAAFEGFMPDDNFHSTYIGLAEKMLGRVNAETE